MPSNPARAGSCARGAIMQEMRPDHAQYHAQWPAAGVVSDFFLRVSV